MDGITPQSKIADDICAVVNEWFQALPTLVEQQRDRSNLLLALIAEFSRAEESAYRAGREDAAREERAEIAEEIAQAIEWTLTVPVEEARETYARRRATGDEDQAREWAVRLRAWKSARQMAAEAARGAGVQPTEEQRAHE